MFGNAPRALWERWLPPDELGRIPLACRSALVDDGQQKVLLETGIGCFFEPQLKQRYGVVEDEHVLLRSLAEKGLRHEDIDVIVLSHLHFDHAGGLLAPYAAGRAPELLFPRARFLVGREAFERAEQPHPRDRASFIPGLTALLQQSGRLELVEADAPTFPGLPPNFRVKWSSGHTPGMLLTHVVGAEQSMFFCADLVPGRPWINLPITMGYDRYAERLIDEKAQLFPELERMGSWLFFTHDSEAAMARLGQDERGRWQPTTTLASLPHGLDLDHTQHAPETELLPG